MGTDEPFEQLGSKTVRTGHLDRLGRLLLVAGAIALAALTLLTWAQYEGGEGGGPLGFLSESSLAISLVAQVLAVLSGALLTGAAFAYVMRAFRLDQR